MNTHHNRLSNLSIAVALAAVTLLVTMLGLNAGNPAQAMPASAPQQGAAEPRLGNWIFVVNSISSNLSVLNSGTGVVYGPLLEGQLGTDGGNRFDIAITPDYRTALISNFGDNAVFLVDITNPISPSVITSVTLPFFAEDIDISADGKYALVTDGGFSPEVASINILSATLVYTAELGSRYANAVAVAPDGTVIVADYFGRVVHTLLLDEMGVITDGNTYTYTYPGYAITDTNGLPWPMNLGLSPDGQTVIVCDWATSTIGIYRVVAPGVLTFTGVITGLEGTFPEKSDSFNLGVQSVAFNAAGDKAYAVVNNMVDIANTNSGDRLAVLNITGPGQVSLEAGGVVTLPHKTGSQLFGVDTVAVAGNKVYLGYPSMSTPDDPTNLAVVDLADYSVTATMVLSKEVSIPTGVAAISSMLSKSVSPSSAKPGEAITYTIRFANLSIFTPTNVVITDTLSALTGASFTHSGITLTQVPGSQYVWIVPVLRPDEGGIITITGVLIKPLAAGTLPNTVTLAVSGMVETANANLTVLNVAPVANAGPDQSKIISSTVTLDGRGSTDDNGDALAYGWTQTGGPEVTFTPDLSLTTFTAPGSPTVLTFTLTVTDTDSLTDTNDVVITVRLAKLTVNTTGTGSGTVNLNPDQAGYTSGTVVTLTAIPGATSIFAGWSGAVTGLTNPVTVTMDADKEVTAAFTQTYTLTPTAGANGALVPNTPQTVNYGASQMFTITPNTGYHIADVGVDGVSIGVVSAYTFTNVTANHTITAAFAINTYTLTVNQAGTGSGTVSLSPNQANYAHGTVVTLTATPSTTSSFAGWSGAIVTTTNPLVLTMDADKVVTAAFKTYKLWLPIVIKN